MKNINVAAADNRIIVTKMRKSADMYSTEVHTCSPLHQFLNVFWFPMEGRPHERCHHGTIPEVSIKTWDLHE